MLLRRCVMVMLFGLVFGAVAHAQAPITSLPRPTGDTDPAPQSQPVQSQTPQYQQTPPQYAPGSVHPITSLPKPPGIDTAPAPAYVPPTPQPTPVPEITTHRTPSASAPAPSAPAPGGQPPASSAPAITNSAPTIAYPTPSVTTSAPHDAIAPQSEPVNAPDQPLHANLSGAAPSETPVLPPTVKRDEGRVHLFSTFGVQFKVGSAGIGFDMATPLAQHFNLRAGGAIFTYAGTYDDSGNEISGNAQFRSGSAYIEYFPWSHRGFHLNFGVVYDGNYFNGTDLVKAGTEFDLGNGTYYSSASDPVHGTVKFDFGKTVAPSFTLGFGNIVPRSKKHFSFPFEVGFMYTGRSPSVAMTLVGSVCDTSSPPNCQKIDTDPSAQANLQVELNNINSNITFLKFYPIISQGIAIKF